MRRQSGRGSVSDLALSVAAVMRDYRRGRKVLSGQISSARTS